MLALITVAEDFSMSRRFCIKATHPVPRASPYSALKESPTTNSLSGAVAADDVDDCACAAQGRALSRKSRANLRTPCKTQPGNDPSPAWGFSAASQRPERCLLQSHVPRQIVRVFSKKAVMFEMSSVARSEADAVPIISVEHIFKSVTDSSGTLRILRDIHFALAARETAAIVGASGSGKSTLLSIIAGLDTPTEGTVRLVGQDIFALNEDDRAALRAQKIGFVFQSFQLMANLSALENVMLPLELSGVRGARAQATEMLGRVGLGQRLGHYPRVLSGGEQQRVALARAFVVKPAVLLADEPTGSLDFATGETVMQLMFELNQELGTTLVLVTHDQAIAERCQRKITIEAGQVVPA
jgi:putative ABC transport system ATP-binding protein